MDLAQKKRWDRNATNATSRQRGLVHQAWRPRQIVFLIFTFLYLTCGAKAREVWVSPEAAQMSPKPHETTSYVSAGEEGQSLSEGH